MLLSEGDEYIEKLVTITTSMYYETVKEVLLRQEQEEN